jgi:hypothetical protein
MKITTADTGPRMTLEISQQERLIAKNLKKEFKQILRELEDAITVIIDLKEAITEQRPSKDDLANKYRGRLLRYRRKIISIFNVFLSHLKKTLEMISTTKGENTIGDPELSNLKGIIMTEVGELSDGASAILDILDEVGREGFTKALELVCAQMEKRQKSIREIIDNQLFSHIDNNILGRMKISELVENIRKNTKIILEAVETK